MQEIIMSLLRVLPIEMYFLALLQDFVRIGLAKIVDASSKEIRCFLLLIAFFLKFHSNILSMLWALIYGYSSLGF
jgi:hypothetical protein